MGSRVGDLVKSPNSKSCHQHTAIGDFVELDPHDRSEYSKVTGIYVLYHISERPLYVGQDREIDKRIKNHNDKFRFKSPIVESGSYVRIEDQFLRERFEAILIKFLKKNAVINKQRVAR